MAPKEKKTESQLADLVIAAIRQHPECDHIVSVAIIRPVQQAPHHPNWDAAWTISGNMTPPGVAFEIARQLQAQFDLV